MMPYRRRSYSRSVSHSSSPKGRSRMDGASLKRDPPSRCSLLLRNLSKGAKESNLRYYFEKYGPVRDVYLPRDYYTGEPRGIGFIEYTCPRDAEDAKYGLDGKVILDREITVVFAMQGRKRPEEFRQKPPSSSTFSKYRSNRYRRRSYSRSSRKRSLTGSSSRRNSGASESTRRNRRATYSNDNDSESLFSGRSGTDSRSVEQEYAPFTSVSKKSTNGKVNLDNPPAPPLPPQDEVDSDVEDKYCIMNK